MAADTAMTPSEPTTDAWPAVVAHLSVLPAFAAPTDLKIGWSPDVSKSDSLSFRFGDSIQAGDTWNLLENGVPIAVNTRYYRGLATDTWETTIAAIPFDGAAPVLEGVDPATQQPTYRARNSWELAANPVILPAAYGLRGLTAGNRYEVRVNRAGAEATSAAVYGRFSGATADGVNETQAGTVSLLDLDYGAAPPPGVAVSQGTVGEQVAALVLDAGSKVTLRIGELGVRRSYTPALDLQTAALSVTPNRPNVVAAAVARVGGGDEWTLTIDTAPLAGRAGMVSLRIENTAPGGNTVAPRYLGIVVRDGAGNVPARPDWLAIGAVNTNDTDAQTFFRGTSATDPTGFKAFDSQYIYLNDGPLKRPIEPVTPTSELVDNPSAWRTSSGAIDGKKLIQSLRESAKFGAIPQIVYYNIMAPNESQAIALANLQNRPFMVEYFKDLKFTLDTIRAFAAGTTVSLILEPDLLAYMMQSAFDTASRTYRDPSTIVAMTDAAYEAGLLPDPGAGNRLPNTLPGFVEAINRGVRNLSVQTIDGETQAVNLQYGWKFNLWAYALPAGGSVAKITDVLGWEAGRGVVRQAAEATVDWYTKAGILTGDAGRKMDFVALDKYGTDGGAEGPQYPQNGRGYLDPPAATYLWNADHWNNYLLFAKTLHESLDGLPVRLWQLPVGHVNGSQQLVGGRAVPDLANQHRQWEDSATSFFFGDEFSGLSNGRSDARAYFLQNQANDPLVKQDPDGTICWGSHLAAARDAGIESIMFGPGLANSTQGGGYKGPPLDGYFWATKAQAYFKNPLPLRESIAFPDMAGLLTAAASSTTRVANGSVPSAVVTVQRTGNLNRSLSLPIKVVGGTADAGSDYRKILLEKMRVRFAPGQSAALLVVPTLPTRKAQPQETLTLRIGNPRPVPSRPANAARVSAATAPVVTTVRTTIVLGATTARPTSVSAAAVARLSNQMRAVETFSNPDNPGQITAQLRAGNYPDPNAANQIGEISGTNGLAAYPLDLRNTPGAFQVDLANIGATDPNNPWLENFGEWKGAAGQPKGSTPFDTQIAFSKSVLLEFFGIEVDASGLITRIPAAAAAVFLHNDAVASADATAWDPAANPLVGHHIDAFQTEQLSLYLAGRSPLDGSTGVTDPRTAPQPVLDMADRIQRQASKSFMYGMYQKFQNHAAYNTLFDEVEKLFGATLKITASTSAFGVTRGQTFWCRMNGSFVVAGTYVSGEGSMFNLLTAFVQAAKNGSGTWVIDPHDPGKNITFTRTTAAGTPARDMVFEVNRTPLNFNEQFPSIFHYGAVVSPLDEGIDWNDKAAWGVNDRSTAAGLGYARLPAAQQVTGTTVVTQPGRYVYSGLAAGETLTLSGPGPFFIVGAPAVGGPVITTAGYGLAQNSNQAVAGGQRIGISAFGMTTPQEVFDASFYGWYAGGVLRLARVNDPTVPAGTPLFLYFVPAAGGDPAAVLANQGAFYDSGSPYFRSARLNVENVDVLGRAASAGEWAAHFLRTPPVAGTGVIDASQATGSVFIVTDDTVATVKLGRGRTVVTRLDGSATATTFVLNAQPLVGGGARPVLNVRAGDTIDATRVSGRPRWTIDNRDQATFDNAAAAGNPSNRYSAWSRYFANQGSAIPTAEFAVLLGSDTELTDPAGLVRGALQP